MRLRAIRRRLQGASNKKQRNDLSAPQDTLELESQ
jgi:hypothetical protein